MLDGSHRWPATPAVTALRHGNSFLGSDQVVLERELLEAGLQFNPVPIVVERGQVSFHHCLTFHSSGPNLGRHDRTAIIFALQDGANHYRYPVEADERLRSHSNDRMCRTLPDGCPDYSDPAVCPVVWEARRTPRR
jgi:ectoine hydroxylase-related dioxygenase (phytanoyl-CoA dioxygenase family)